MKEKFNDRSIYWTQDNINYNLMLVKSAEEYLNRKLKAKGYVTIFEAYDQLGLTLDLNRLLSVNDPKELYWGYGEDVMIDFGAKENKDSGIIELDFNISID